MKISTAQSRLAKYPKKCEEQIKVSSSLIVLNIIFYNLILNHISYHFYIIVGFIV